MAFLITTTGTLSPVTFIDLGDRTFNHPTINYDLELEYFIENIRESDSIGDALDNGYITAFFNGYTLTTSTQLLSVLPIHTHSASVITYDGLLTASNVKDAIDFLSSGHTSGGGITYSSILHGIPYFDTTQSLSSSNNLTYDGANLSVGSTKILNVATGTNPLDAANKGQLDLAMITITASVDLFKNKAGYVLSASFSGTPLTYAASFATPYLNSNYSISISGMDPRIWSIETYSTTGFTINSNSNSPLTDKVFYQTVPTGENILLLPKTKSGALSPNEFSGSPLVCTILFITPYSTIDYSISIVGIDTRIWTVSTYSTTGFTINSNSDSSLTGKVFYQTTLIGEN